MPNNVRNQGFGTTAELAATNPYLAPQETWKDTTLGRTKTGPGLWNDLTFDDQYAEDHGGGSLPTPGSGDAGKVVTVNASHDGYELDAAGSGTSLAQRHLTLPFTAADKVALKAGLDGFADDDGVYVAADGDRITLRWFEVVTIFNGTTPFADVGTFGSITTGLFYWDSSAWGLDAGPDVNDVGDGMTVNGSGQVVAYEPALLDGTAQPKVCASQTGATDGAQLDSTVGSAVAHIIVLLAV